MSRLFGQETQSGVGFRAHHMSKADTDQGLGPGSERSREAVLKAQRELDARSKKGASPEVTPSPEPAAVEKKPVDKTAVTEPGVGKVERQDDPLDNLLGGFGPSRPESPAHPAEGRHDPAPEPLRKELTPTAPGKRQRKRNTALALVTFLVVAGVGVTLVAKMSGSNPTTPPRPPRPPRRTPPRRPPRRPLQPRSSPPSRRWPSTRSPR